MSIEKEDVTNALKVLATMLKAAKLSTGDIAELMIKELEFVDFVPATPIKDQYKEIVKFNKTFEALYSISMKMADKCIGGKDVEARFSKLEEEYQELIVEYDTFLKAETKNYREVGKRIHDEMGDVLFVLLHIGHKLGFTAFDLLHTASSKMLSRMNDVNYIAKN